MSGRPSTAKRNSLILVQGKGKVFATEIPNQQKHRRLIAWIFLMKNLIDKYNKITIRLLSRLESVAKDNNKGKIIYITSASDNEGKTSASELLAYCSASLTNSRVLLVDGNMDNPKVATDFLLEGQRGLSDILIDGENGSEAYKQTSLSNLFVLTAGNKRRSGLLFKKNSVEEIIQQVRESFDLIFVDSSSISRSGSNSLATTSDGVVIIIDSTATRREVLQHTIRELNVPKERILGAILNKKRYYIPSYIHRRL